MYNNKTENISGSYGKTVIGETTETYNNKTETGNVLKYTGGDFDLSDMRNLVYKQPVLINNKLYSVTFKDHKGETYNVLVGDVVESPIIGISNFNAVGDGVTNDTASVKEAVIFCNENGYTLQFDKG